MKTSIISLSPDKKSLEEIFRDHWLITDEKPRPDKGRGSSRWPDDQQLVLSFSIWAFPTPAEQAAPPGCDSVNLALWDPLAPCSSSLSNSIQPGHHRLGIWSPVSLLSSSIWYGWPGRQCWWGSLQPCTDRNQVSLLHKRNINWSDGSWKQKCWQRCNSQGFYGARRKLCSLLI